MYILTDRELHKYKLYKNSGWKGGEVKMDKCCGGNCGEENWGRTDNSRLERIIYMIADTQTLATSPERQDDKARAKVFERDGHRAVRTGT